MLSILDYQVHQVEVNNYQRRLLQHQQPSSFLGPFCFFDKIGRPFCSQNCFWVPILFKLCRTNFVKALSAGNDSTSCHFTFRPHQNKVYDQLKSGWIEIDNALESKATLQSKKGTSNLIAVINICAYYYVNYLYVNQLQAKKNAKKLRKK